MPAPFLFKLIAALLSFFSLSLAGEPLLVAAAADLAPLERQLLDGFSAAGGGKMQFTFGSSGMLARQVENGAPYDLFLCANDQLIQDLAAQGKLIPGSVAAYATGRLGLWSARQRPADLGALLQPGIRLIAIANPHHAPYGVAARSLLESAGLWTRLQPKIVLAENVRQAYEYASSGNADAVLTAWTLLWDKPGAKLLSGSGQPPIRQSGAIVAGTGHEAQARAFMRFLLGASGQSILRAHGLFPPAVAAR